MVAARLPRRRNALMIAPAIGLLGLLGLLAAGGCDRDRAGDGPVTIRFWNGFTGPDGRTMLAIVRRFNDENPDVRIVMQRMEWGTYYNKLFVAAIGGRGPDVFVSHTDSLARFRHAGLLRPVDDLLAGPGGIDPADLDENVWAAAALPGDGREAARHDALPLDIHLLGMFYNRALFRAAGVVDAAGEAAPPRTRDEFLDAAARLTRDADGDGRPEQWGFVFTWLRTNVYTLIRQFGGDLFARDDDGDAPRETLAAPANVAALRFAADLIRERRVAPSPADFDSFIGFRQGKVGIVFEGIYMLPELRRQADLDFAAAPLPTLGDRPAAWANSHNLCLSPDLAGRDLEAARRFVVYLSDHSLDWADGGQIPVRKSLRDTPRFAAMTAQRAFAAQIPHAAYMPRVRFVSEYQAEYEQAIERALRGSAAPEAALRRAAADVRRIMARYAADERPATTAAE